eukprot:463967-Rhodomonas_salina.1
MSRSVPGQWVDQYQRNCTDYECCTRTRTQKCPSPASPSSYRPMSNSTVLPYALAMRCPVLPYHTALRAPYALSSTELSGTVLRAPYAVTRTALYRTMLRREWYCAVAYGAMRLLSGVRAASGVGDFP